jgi:hypothetical protein
MTERIKKMEGRYHTGKIVWKIELPYRSETFLYAGPESGADSYGKYLKKKYKWPYTHKKKKLIG